MKIKREDILKLRDTERYSKQNSSKALIARSIALQVFEFLPYFEAADETEESDTLGYIFGYKVILGGELK